MGRQFKESTNRIPGRINFVDEFVQLRRCAGIDVAVDSNKRVITVRTLPFGFQAEVEIRARGSVERSGRLAAQARVFQFLAHISSSTAIPV